MEIYHFKKQIKKQLIAIVENKGEKVYFDFNIEICFNHCDVFFSGNVQINTSHQIELIQFDEDKSVFQYPDFEAKMTEKSIRFLESELVNEYL
jgi:hypothetical protein